MDLDAFHLQNLPSIQYSPVAISHAASPAAGVRWLVWSQVQFLLGKIKVTCSTNISNMYRFWTCRYFLDLIWFDLFFFGGGWWVMTYFDVSSFAILDSLKISLKPWSYNWTILKSIGMVNPSVHVIKKGPRNSIWHEHHNSPEPKENKPKLYMLRFFVENNMKL